MTRSPLPFLLAEKPSRTTLDPEVLDSRTATTAARFWAGKPTGSQSKTLCVERINVVWSDPARIAAAVASLRPEEREVLAVVRRYGGTISGNLLELELRGRGLLEQPNAERVPLQGRARKDLVLDLCERLLLLRGPGYYYSEFSSWPEPPDVTLPRAVEAAVVPAASLGWAPSAPLEKPPESSSLRSPGQVLVDLEQTTRALEAQGRWRVNRSGALPVAGRNRLGKRLATRYSDPLEPPDRVALHYGLVDALGLLASEGTERCLERERVGHLFHLREEAQVSGWIRAWMTLDYWQDGLGAVPDRESYEEQARIDPTDMRGAREHLVWALTRVAHGPGEWLDFGTFVRDLFVAAGEHEDWPVDFRYAWHPRLAAAAGTAALPPGSEDSWAFWIDGEGVWVANALLSTLVHLGVVERGRSGGARSERWSFRLTPVGRAVFGAPEVRLEPSAGGEACLTVQPSHEVLLYLDSADGAAVTALGRIANRESTSGVVQSFALTRESVYGALESGMTLAEIEAFLASRSRNGLPPNVQRSLAEWSRKREALVVRGGVALVANLSEGEARFVVASDRAARKQAKERGLAVEAEPFARTLKVDEHGLVSSSEPMPLVARARLQRFARAEGGAWRITADSVRAARERGVTAETVLAWLGSHARSGVPPILVRAIRNWAGKGGKVFLGDLVVLQVDDPQTFEALERSDRLRPFLRGTLAPGCLVVSAEGREEVARILNELGFSLEAPCRLERHRP